MRVLGAVLAGGQARRFGSDKALAELDGRPLIAHALEALAQQCEARVIVGRDTGFADVPCLADRPGLGLGPVAGIAAALAYADANGFDAVLTVPVDGVGLPADLLAQLGEPPACAATLPVLGLWPVAALAVADALLAGPGSHAVMAFAERAGARLVTLDPPPVNLNTRAALDRWQESGGG